MSLTFYGDSNIQCQLIGREAFSTQSHHTSDILECKIKFMTVPIKSFIVVIAILFFLPLDARNDTFAKYLPSFLHYKERSRQISITD